MKISNSKWLLGLITLYMSWTMAALGQTVLIDFGNDTAYRSLSTAAPDENGNFWNSVDSGVYWTNLVDIANTATAIDFGFVTVAGADSYNGPAGATSTDTGSPNYYVTKVTNTSFNAAALGNLGATNAVFDYYVSSSFTFAELDPAKYYKLTFFGSHKYVTDSVTTYDVTDSNGVVIASADLFVGQGADHNENGVATISNLQPDGANKIYVSFEGENGNSGYINAIQLVVLDEPEVEVVQNDVILIDFGSDATYRGLSVASPDVNGNYWNVRGYSSLVNMVTTSNTATSIGLVTTSAYGTDSYNGPAGATDTPTLTNDVLNTEFNPAALGELGVTNAVFDFFSGTAGAPVTFELQGLNPGRGYNLTFFGSKKFTGAAGDTITRYSVTDSNGVVLASADLAVTTAESEWLHNQDTLVSITNIWPDANNKIYVTFAGKSFGIGWLNAMKIEELPEPAVTYSSWAEDYGLIYGEQGDDDDDGLINLYEYGQGGNPTNGFIDSYLPILEQNGSGSLLYVYPKRTADSSLSYYLELSDSLVITNWSNSGYTEEPETGVIDADFVAVTNNISTTSEVKFIRLMIENQ